MTGWKKQQASPILLFRHGHTGWASSSQTLHSKYLGTDQYRKIKANIIMDKFVYCQMYHMSLKMLIAGTLKISKLE